MRAAMEGKLAALEQRIPIGEAEVRAVFGKGSKLVAGCMVTEGVLRADCFVVVRLLHHARVVHLALLVGNVQNRVVHAVRLLFVWLLLQILLVVQQYLVRWQLTKHCFVPYLRACCRAYTQQKGCVPFLSRL